MKRYKNGRYKSKRTYQLESKLRLYTTMTLLTMALIMGFALQPWTATYQNIVHMHEIQTVHAEEIEVIEVIEVPVYSDKVQQAINEIPHQSSTTEKWIAYIYEQSEKAGVDGDVMAHIAYCESQFHNIQSNCIYDFTDASIGIYAGEQEKSYGIYMFSTPHHPITVAQAYDPYFSIDRAISFVKKGQFIWYGYDPKTDRCRSGVAPYWK